MIAVIIIVVIIVILLLIFIGNYNGLVGLRNKVKTAWAQIDVQLKEDMTSSRISLRRSKDTKTSRVLLWKQ